MCLFFLVAGTQYPHPQGITGRFDEDENKTNSGDWLSQSPDLNPFEHQLLYF